MNFICSVCGSDDVTLDAWARWDRQRQEWLLSETFDRAWCHACDGETRLREIKVEPASAA
jgi:hypothetical protein